MKKCILLLASLACFSAIQAQNTVEITKLYFYKSGTYTDLDSNSIPINTLSTAQVYFGFQVTNNSTTDLPSGEALTVLFSPFNDNQTNTYTLTAALPAGASADIHDLTSYPVGQYQNSLTTISDKEWQASYCASVTATTTLGNLGKGTNVDKCVTFSIIQTADVAANALENVKVYPTLTSNFVKIENIEEATITLYTVNGQEIKKMEQVNGTFELNLTDLSNGVYLLKIQNDKGVKTEKIQVIR